MKIAILGAGFTGLSCGYRLVKQGHDVTLFEKDREPGGLAIGYQEKGWGWSLERHYHHWFINDNSVLSLARELNYNVIIKRPITSSYVDGDIYQLDSPQTLLRFSKLSFVDRLRTGIALALLRYNPIWQPLERFRAKPYLEFVMGKKAFQTIWEPLLVNKLGNYADTVSLAWFWARIFKRTGSLAYPEGGFLHFANRLVHTIEKEGGRIFFNTEVIELTSKGKPQVKVQSSKFKVQSYAFDKVIVTLPSFLFVKIAPRLPEEYKKKLSILKGIGAINMVLRLRKPFMPDNTYWLNICDSRFPILAIVEHTNFMDKKYYNNEHLVYAGNYVSANHLFFTKTKEELLNIYDPYLRKINPTYKKSLIGYEIFKAPFAQPIIPVNYSKMIPSMETPLPHVFLANIEQVYPWDRGTNYAVELGEKVAKVATKQSLPFYFVKT